ncbi:TetR/AcrR family transcriptional regulator [Klenkia sp. PcliD-1-E]|uniref:TetR/AcrR family transcriptional regulator n=1 Tax=Klenkia sp. PcliD-1-E TaxID=2954492 RepID=UPI002096EA94|nr:TetR family transcriptional regulator [Klenkia sp. PcliD-1-E]MCO7218678.1 TetR family transcriptional regulator [Klenkia sp. PcliD-1-E]
MRSADADRTARARIRDAAVARFASDGFGASVRTIAADAGVSPGLLGHHYGSKDGLRTACDQYVLDRLHDTETGALAGGPAAMLATLGQVEEFAPLVGYLLQTFVAGGPLATTVLGRMTADAERGLAEAVEAGTVKPSRDPAARAAHLVDVGIGTLLAFTRRHPPVDGDLRPVLRAYADARTLPALELYTHGLLADSAVLDGWLAGAGS